MFKRAIPGALKLPFLFAALGVCLFATTDLSSYRGFRFGMKLPQAAELAEMKPSDAKLETRKPALIQVLDFEPNLFHSAIAKGDPVSAITLSFQDGELFRIAVVYDRYKVEGMTAEDMIQALSASYGTATRPKAEIAYHSYYAESAPVVARWEDSEYSYNLIRADDRSTFALILYSKALDARAQAAIVEAARLDALEAPQREAERLSKQAADNQMEQEKARLANKASFRP
jgi:hypothetical protein